MVLPKPVDGARVAVKVLFERWVKEHKVYGPLHKTLPKEVAVIATDALDKMTPLRPEGFQFWWAKEHDRYIRTKVKQRELLLINEIIYYFLCAYVRGELKRKDEQPLQPAAQLIGPRPDGKEKAKQKAAS